VAQVAAALSLLLAPVIAGAGVAPAAPTVDSAALLSWTHLAPAAAPPARVHAAMAFDAAAGDTVMFGGRSGSQLLADTWTWDGSTWTVQNPATSPPALESASMAYDNIGHRIVLFAGIGDDGNATNGTWAWSGGTWTALAPAAAPPPRYAASIAADGATSSVVIFGGLSAPGAPLADTWSWNGSTWTQTTSPANSPDARSGAAMTFDATRGTVVLFGGATASDVRADTWIWDGSTWAQQTPANSPPARTDAGFGFDDGTQTALLFGGTRATGGNIATAGLGDTWLWNGSNWSTPLTTPILPAFSPSTRLGMSVAGAPAPQRLLLFGGQPTWASSNALNDTWTVGTVLSARPVPTTTPATSAGSSTTVVGSSTAAPTTTGKSGSTTPAPVATPTTARPAVRAPLGVTTRSAHRGDPVKVSGSGFLPGATVVITFNSVRTIVGTTKADAKGRFSLTVLVPEDAPAGEHHLEADGPANAGGHAVLVAQVSIAPLSSRHSWVLPALMVTLTLILAAGAGVVLTMSTKRHLLPGR
jgi:Galactose oxidase, central domain